MARINGRRLGLWSLRLDAAYCLVLGVFVAVAAPGIATVVTLPPLVLSGVGIVVAVWAALVFWMTLRLRIRLAVRLVMGVNVLAAALIAVTALTATTALVAFAVLAVAIDVGAFAVSQAVALRTMPGTPSAA